MKGRQLKAISVHRMMITADNINRDHKMQLIPEIFLLILSHLCTTITHGNPELWPLLTVGRCSETCLCYKHGK